MMTRLTTDSGIRRTAEGLELTGRALKGLIALAVLVAGGFLFISRTAQPVQQREFLDTARALRTDLRDIREQSTKTSRAVLAMQCRQAGNPIEFCSDFVTPVQAGRPQRTP